MAKPAGADNAPSRSFADTAQKWLALLGAVATPIAAYYAFVKDRKYYPHLNIGIEASDYKLTEKLRLIRVEVRAENAGASQIKFDSAKVRIQQVTPIACNDKGECLEDSLQKVAAATEMSRDTIAWPTLAVRNISYDRPEVIEAGEKTTRDFEFVVPAQVKLVRIYSFVCNAAIDRKCGTGWYASKIFEIDKPKEKTDAK